MFFVNYVLFVLVSIVVVGVVVVVVVVIYESFEVCCVVEDLCRCIVIVFCFFGDDFDLDNW